MDKNEKVLKLIDQVNNGDLGVSDIEGMFGDFETFFNFLKRRNLHYELDINKIEDMSIQNDLLIAYLDDDFPSFVYIMENQFSDIVYENGKFYFRGDREDLAELFCDRGRNTAPLSLIEEVLRGDYHYDYWDSVDVYDDVIYNLDLKNLAHLKTILLEKNPGQISPETDLLENIAEEQGHPEYVELTSENIEHIFRDSESTEYILENYYEDLEGELVNIYNSAISNAWEDTIYDSIFDKLTDDYFVGSPEYVTVTVREKNIQYFMFEIQDFVGVIKDFLNQGSEPYDYYGNYLDLLVNEVGCLDLYLPDYPSKVDDYLNELFKEYI